MSQVSKEKKLKNINDIPVDMPPGFYKIVHLLKHESVGKKINPGLEIL